LRVCGLGRRVAHPSPPDEVGGRPQTSASYNTNNQILSTNARAVTSRPAYDLSGDVTTDGINQYLYDAEDCDSTPASAPYQNAALLKLED
jgi:hypothetical protein